MHQTRLEHLNITVRDPEALAERLCILFGWDIRWQGPAMADGYTVHVGTDREYLALYRAPDERSGGQGLNHIGVVVADLDAAADTVRAQGLVPHSFADYSPGRRFYFDDPQGVEFEVVSYS